MKKVVINGFGRIGRIVFRRLWNDNNIEIVAINDLTSTATLSYLLEFDSAQGKFLEGKIKFDSENIIIENKKIRVFSEKDPRNLPWAKLGIDLVIESTGLFTSYEAAKVHLDAGAKKVVISAPATGDMKTIVYNVNHKTLTSSDKIISGASCTTNCLAPVVDILHKEFKIVKGLMLTVHSVTNDQRILDLPHKDFRRGRAGISNIIPTSTGAAKAVSLVIPDLKGKLDGMAMRVPTITGSAVYLTCEFKKSGVTAEAINALIQKNSNETIKYETKPMVSTDTIGTSFGSIFDSLLTKVLSSDGNELVQIVSWYDNESSYVAQLVRTVKYFIKL